MPMLASIASAASKALGFMLSMGVSFAKDIYFNLVVLLLRINNSVSGVISPTSTPFITDASSTTLQLLLAGDTKADSFNPLRGDGYYGTWLDGTTGFITIPNNASFNLSTNSFTMEAWVFTTGTTQITIMEKRTGASYDWIIFLNEVANYLTVYMTGIVTKGQATATFPFGQWVHVAWVRNGTVFTLYQNGVSVYTTTNAAAATYNAANSIVIGADTGSGNRFFWPGYIAAVRIVNGTAIYTSAFTPSTTALTAVSNTVLLTCQSYRLVDLSSLASTLTITGTVKVVPATPMLASLPSTLSTYGSAYFDGTGDQLNAPNNNAYSFGTNDFTIEFWLYSAVAWSSQPASCGIVGQKANDTTNGWVLYRDGGSPTKLNARFALQNNFFTTSDVPSFQWVHFALTKVGTTARWFINGVLDATGTISANISDATGIFYVGFSQTWSGYFNGYISNLRIINGTGIYTSNFTVPTTPLTAVTNTALLSLQYNGGANNYNVVEDGYFDHTVTRFGNASLSTFTPFSNTGFSMYFNGTSDAVNTTAPMPTSGDFTLECWFWLSSNLTYKGAGNYAARLFSGAATSVMEFNIGGTASDPTPQFLSVTSYGGASYQLSSAVINISIRDWHHVVAVRSGSNNAIFFDGVRVATLSSSFAFTAANASLGGHASATNYLNWLPGYINNARIMNSAAYDPTQTTITVPTRPHTINSTTTLLIGQDSRIVDQSVTRATITYAGTPQIQAVGPFGTYNLTQPGYSIYFSGAEQISAATSANFNQTGDFTMEAWVYLTVNQGAEAFIIGEETANKLKLTINTLTPYVINPTVGNVIVSSIVLTLKTWYHLAVVRSGSATNNVTLYVNGAIAGQATFTTNTNSATTFNIGGRAAATYFTGYMSNARYVVGTAVYTGVFTPPTSPLSVITNTKFLIKPAPCIQEDAFYPALTLTGSPKVSPLNPFAATFTSTSPYSPTVNGGSLALDGTGDYLQLPQTAAIWNLSTYDFSIEAWVYPTSRVTNGAYILASSNYGVGTDFLFQILNAGTLQIYLLTGTVATSTATIPLYQWTHVCVLKISNVYTLYINGNKDGTVTLATTIPSTYVPTIGNSSNNTGTTYFPGFISGLKVNKGVAKLPYSAPFYPVSTPPVNDSGTILLCNFTSGGIVDNAMKSNYETVGGVQVAPGVSKNGSGSIYFPGSSYLLGTTRAMLSLTSDFTIEFWVKGGAQAGIYPILLARNASYASGNFYLCFSHTSAANKISIHHTTYGSPFYQHPTTINDNAWHHVALVRTGGSVVLYVDGVGTTAYTGTGATVAWDYSIPLIGATPSDGSATLAQTSFNGYIDEFRITKYARYSGNFTPAQLISQ